jgi:hypothetical protein
MFERIKPYLGSLLVVPVAYYFLDSRGEYGLIDNFDLIIHEAGHFFFSFFGNFIHASGGTLMQIIIPILFIMVFFKSKSNLGIQLSFLLLGQNFINISVYAADASIQKLPLFGKGKHDWHYILGELNLLENDAEVGYFFVGLAILSFVCAFLIPFLFRK